MPDSDQDAMEADPSVTNEERARLLVAPLFQPVSIRSLSLPNRIVMSPMTREFSPDGVPTEDVVAYYRRRAEAETGLVITEGVGIDHPAALGEAGLGGGGHSAPLRRRGARGLASSRRCRSRRRREDHPAAVAPGRHAGARHRTASGSGQHAALGPLGTVGSTICSRSGVRSPRFGAHGTDDGRGHRRRHRWLCP